MEEFRRLLREYTHEKQEYDKALAALEERQAAGNADPDSKAQLEERFGQLNALYDQITRKRGELAEARDTAAV